MSEIPMISNLSDSSIELEYDEIVHKTDLSYLFKLWKDKPVWIPESVVEKIYGDTILIQRWWAEGENLI